MPDLHPKIAYLGWGSLIWAPRSLPIRRPWFNDGPLLPIEFARQSCDDRITLVIVPKKLAEVLCVRTLWALMVARSLDDAIKELAKREMPRNPDESPIGRWPCGPAEAKDFTELVESWACARGLDGAASEVQE